MGITFDKESGRSGPNAYRKLAQFLDEEGEAPPQRNLRSVEAPYPPLTDASGALHHRGDQG